MILIRKCAVSDESDIVNVCYRTGYMGEDLSELNRFNDKVLFGYFFCSYYPRYERDSSFVAVDTDADDVIGYIIGSADTKRQRVRFALKMGWRIAARILFVTLWKYPETIRTILNFTNSIGAEYSSRLLYDEYPAHLHINILPAYQRTGIGGKLINAFENNIREKANGIHLSTTNKNVKAVPFYAKMGYEVLYKYDSRLWNREGKDIGIIFGKRLD